MSDTATLPTAPETQTPAAVAAKPVDFRPSWIPTLLQDEGFRSLPYEDRAAKLNQAAEGAADWLRRQPDFDEEAAHDFADLYQSAQQAIAPPAPQGALGAFFTPIAAHAVPNVVGTVSGIAAAAGTSMTGPGAVLADVAASTAGTAAAQGAQDYLLGGPRARALQEQESQNLTKHPVATRMGQLAVSVPTMLNPTSWFKKGTQEAAKSGLKKAGMRSADAASGGARMGAIASTGAVVGGVPGSHVTDIPKDIAESAIVSGPLGLMGPARSLLVSLGVRAPADAAILATSQALYDRAVKGKPLDLSQITGHTAESIPGFLVLNALAAIAHRRAARSAEPGAGKSEPATESTQPATETRQPGATPVTGPEMPGTETFSSADPNAEPAPITQPVTAEGGSSPPAGPVSSPEPAPTVARSGPIAEAFGKADAMLGEAEPRSAEAEPAKPETPGARPLNTNFDLNGKTGGYLNADILKHGSDLVAGGLRDFAAWAGEMVRKFGDAVRAVLRTIWEQVVPAEVRGAGPNARGSGFGAAGVDAPKGPRSDEWEAPRFSQRIQASDALKGAWHDAFEPKPYERRTVEGWAEFERGADSWVAQHGPETAAKVVLDPTVEMAPDERVILAGSVLRAADAGSVAGAPGMNDVAAAMADFLGTQGSRAGQQVRAYGYMVERDPTLTLAEFERNHTQAVETDVERKLKTPGKAVSDEVKQTVAEEKEKAVADTERKNKPLVDAAQRIMDRLAREFSDTLAALTKKAKTDGAKLWDLVRRGMRDEIKDFVEQAQALGVSEADAHQLSELVDEGRRRTAAVADAKQRQAEAQAFEKGVGGIIDRLAEQFSDTPREARKQARSKLAGVHDLVQKGMREEIPDLQAQLEALGVAPGEAAQLSRLVNEGRRRAETVARAKAGQRLIESLGPNVAREARAKLPKLLDLLVRAAETGVLGRTEFLDAYAEAMGLPRFTPELRARLRDLVNAARTAPEGTPKAEAMRALQDELAIFSGVTAKDALMSAWYANILSGLSTQGINIWGNLTNLLLRTPAAALVNHPADTLAMLSGLLRGSQQGLAQAARILRGGVGFKAGDKYGGNNGSLELIRRQGGPRTAGQWLAWAGSLGPVGRLVFRGLGGMDAFFYATAAEGRAHLAASRAARARGLKPGTPEFANAMAEELGFGRDGWRAALNQATAEAKASGKPLKTAEINARAYEIVEAQRPSELRHESHRYGDLLTYNFEPEGNSRLIYNAIISLQKFNIAGVPVLRPFMPFARMVANLTGQNLDFTPAGILRGIKGNYLGESKEPMAPWEARERLAAGVLGTVAMGAAFGWAYSNLRKRDDEPGFMLYGPGPSNKTLMPNGWRPYTFQIGNRYVSYAETPLVLALAPIGAIMDKMRYTKDWDERDTMSRMTYYLQATTGVLTKQGVLSSMASFLDILQGRKRPESLVSNYTSGVIPAQGLLRDINTLFDGRKIDATSVAAAVFRDVPVLRGYAGRPALNVWGEPVKFDGLDRIPVVKRVLTGGGTPDPVSDWMASRRVTVPALPQSVKAGQYLPTAERAAKLNRIHALIWTDAEQYEFAQKSGQKLKETIASMMQHTPMVVTQKQLQQRIDAATERVRSQVMREMLMRQK